MTKLTWGGVIHLVILHFICAWMLILNAKLVHTDHFWLIGHSDAITAARREFGLN